MGVFSLKWAWLRKIVLRNSPLLEILDPPLFGLVTFNYGQMAFEAKQAIYISLLEVG